MTEAVQAWIVELAIHKMEKCPCEFAVWYNASNRANFNHKWNEWDNN